MKIKVNLHIHRLNTIMAISPIEIIIKIVENFPSLINNLR